MGRILPHFQQPISPILVQLTLLQVFFYRVFAVVFYKRPVRRHLLFLRVQVLEYRAVEAVVNTRVKKLGAVRSPG